MPHDYKAALASASAELLAGNDIVAATKAALRDAEAELAKYAPATILSAGGDLMAGAAAHTAATARLAYLAAALQAAEARVIELASKHRIAHAETNRPAFEAAVARRLSAAIAADAARALLDAATKERAAATAEIERCHARGLARPFDGAYMMSFPFTEAGERDLWEQVQ